MTLTTVPAIRRRRVRFAGFRRRARGTCAVIALVLSAADVLLSALTGWPELGHVGRQLGRAVRDAYRRGAWEPRPPVTITTIIPEEETADDQHQH